MGTFLEEPLVSLGSVLQGVCDLLSFYEFLSKTDNSSDLYLLLTQNIVDSCNWVSDKTEF